MATTSQTFIIHGINSWVVPDGVSSIQVECWAPGGSSNKHMSAGGGGAYAKTNNIPVISGDTYQVYVGQTLPTGYAQDSYSVDNLCRAVGGQCSYADPFPPGGSIPGLGGNSLNCVGDVKVSGGKGGWTGSFASSGTAGGGGGCAGNDGQNGGDGGAGGAGSYGGGTGGNGYAAHNNGGFPGGGASGTLEKEIVSGGQGQIIITWTI